MEATVLQKLHKMYLFLFISGVVVSKGEGTPTSGVRYLKLFAFSECERQERGFFRIK